MSSTRGEGRDQGRSSDDDANLKLTGSAVTGPPQSAENDMRDVELGYKTSPNKSSGAGGGTNASSSSSPSAQRPPLLRDNRKLHISAIEPDVRLSEAMSLQVSKDARNNSNPSEMKRSVDVENSINKDDSYMPNMVNSPVKEQMDDSKIFTLNHKGHSELNAAQLLITFGLNELPEKIVPKWLIFCQQLWQPMPIMIWLACIIEAAIENYPGKDI